MDTIKVLMVDDESRMRKLVKDFLTREGYIVLEAGDGEQALDIFMEDKNISLVILDVMMPKMDGWETLKEIRKFSQVPVIMLTAKADERDELQGFNLGVDEYITKPFSPKILVARVAAILRRMIRLRKGNKPFVSHHTYHSRQPARPMYREPVAIYSVWKDKTNVCWHEAITDSRYDFAL